MDNFENQDGIKSRERVKEHGEVYTPQEIVIDMHDLKGIDAESYKIDSTFLEPACGNGNFLVETLKRKLSVVVKESTNQEEFDINTIRAVCSIYGIDIMVDNIVQAKERLTSIIKATYEECGYEQSTGVGKSIKYVLDKNIILGNTLEKKMGSNFKQDLIFNSWEFKGTKVKRRSWKADSIDIEMNCDYQSVNYDKLYRVKDIEEEDVEL